MHWNLFGGCAALPWGFVWGPDRELQPTAIKQPWRRDEHLSRCESRHKQPPSHRPFSSATTPGLLPKHAVSHLPAYTAEQPNAPHTSQRNPLTPKSHTRLPTPQSNTMPPHTHT
eukprot:364156-Chlamydomonas_euryale.AAC.7